MKREEVDELQIIIGDLRMALEIKEQIDAGEERGLVNFADGTRISVPISDEAKSQLANKITGLSALLKEKVAGIKD